MKSIPFKGFNNISHRGNIPIFTKHTFGKHDSHIHKWHLNFFERIQILFTGTIWAISTGYKKSMHPFHISVDKSEVVK